MADQAKYSFEPAGWRQVPLRAFLRGSAGIRQSRSLLRRRRSSPCSAATPVHNESIHCRRQKRQSVYTRPRRHLQNAGKRNQYVPRQHPYDNAGPSTAIFGIHYSSTRYIAHFMEFSQAFKVLVPRDAMLQDHAPSVMKSSPGLNGGAKSGCSCGPPLMHTLLARL
jgi:hypothetical protein